MSDIIYVRASSAQVRQAISNLSGVMSGRLPMFQDKARELQLLLGVSVMTNIKEAYVVKARGGIDAAGQQWAPLAPSTIARRRKKGIPSAKTQQEAQRDLIEAIRKKRAARTPKGKEKADKDFDAAMKKLAGPDIEILRDTGRLFNSLSPGTRGELLPDGVIRYNPGEIIIGTNVNYGKYHQHGTSKMPQRRLWPEPKDWPKVWWADLRYAATHGAMVILKAMLGS